MRLFYAIAGLAAAALFLSLIYIWFHLPDNFTQPDRIGLMQAVIELLGFTMAIYAGWFAAQQFQAARRKPDLYIWLGKKGQKELKINKEGNVQELVRVILENRGPGVARYVKVEMRFLMPPSTGVGGIRRVALSGGADLRQFWTVKYFDYTLCSFWGGDEFICYDKDCLELGAFHFRVYREEPFKEEVSPRCQTECELRAERMRRNKQTLVIDLDT